MTSYHNSNLADWTPLPREERADLGRVFRRFLDWRCSGLLVVFVVDMEISATVFRWK
jgi:hypothetical protein